MTATLGLLACAVVTALAGTAPDLQSSPPPQTITTTNDRRPPTNDQRPTTNDQYSLARIRQKLERPPAITLARQDGQLPVYRLTIEGYQPRLSTWRDNLDVKAPRIAPGGPEFARMQWMAIKPTAWGVPW